MSGVGGNTSRLVGTARYVTINQSQCLRRSMSNLANQSNNITRNSATQVKSNDLSSCQYAGKQQDTQVKKASAEYWNIMSAAANKISSIAENLKNTIITNEEEEEEEEKPLISKVGKFNLSLYGGTVTLKAQGIDKTYYWDAPLNIEGDKELMENLQNTIAVKEEVKLGKFNLLFDNDKLILKIQGSPKSFIFNHKLDITEKSAKNLQNRRDTSMFFPQDKHFIVSAYDTKMTIKTEEGEKTIFPEFSGETLSINGLPIEGYIEENQIGIKTEENDKTFVLKHTINIKVNDEKPAENINNAVKKFLEIFGKTDKFEIIIKSGEGTLNTQENDGSVDFENSLRFVVEMSSKVLNTEFHLRFRCTEPYVSAK